MTSIGTNQHFVPQFLLKGFCEASTKRVWVLDKETSSSYPTHIKNVASSKGFNDVHMGSTVVAFDDSFTKLENDTATILDALRSGGNLQALSNKDRIVISNFVASQFLRTDAQRKRYQAMTEDLYKMFNADTATEEFLRAVAPISAEVAKRETISMQWELTADFAPHVLGKNWILYRAQGLHEFVLSDAPVVMYNRLGKPGTFSASIGFAVVGVQIFLPISRKLCLCFLCPSIHKFLTKCKRQAATVHTETINRLLHALDVQELTVKDAEVGDANALQISHAERQIFGSERALSNIRDLLDSSPQLRNKLRYGPIR